MIMGLFDVMHKNARLKRNLDKAKNVQAQREFPGPDGEYIAKFNRISTGAKDDIPYAIFEFTVADVEGQESLSGQKLPIIYIRFADGDYSTLEENQAQFFELLQKLGVDTVNLTQQQIEKEVEALQKDKPECKVAVVTKKGKYKNLYLRGVAQEGATDVSYKAPAEQEVDEEAEWNEVDASESADADGDDDEYIGMEVKYKPPRALKAKQCTITAVDRETETVSLLSSDGKEYTDVPFDKLEE